jgi:glycosyltransferase involved in cell wall biosynthesis
MRIGFDAKRIYHNQTGLGNYGRNLVAGLEARYPEHDYLLFTPPNATVSFTTQKARVIYPDLAMSGIWRSYSIIRQLVLEKVDIYHGLSNEMPFSLAGGKIKVVVSIHDIIFRKYPKAYAFPDRLIYERKTRFALRHADIILASSEATARDLSETYQVDRRKIKVLYPAIESIFYNQEPANISLPSTGIPEEFLLFVGTGNERKNLKVLVDAYNTLPEKERIPVMVVGGKSKYRDFMEVYIAHRNLQSAFIFVGACNNETLKVLYKKATSLIYPSLYEGYGMPVAEALVCGCPVIASQASSIPEAGGDAALYFHPDHAEELASLIQQLRSNPALRESMIEKGHQHQQCFDPQKLTDTLMEVYTGLLGD